MMTLRHWWVGVLATLWMTVPAFAATVGVAPRVDGFDVEEVAQLSPGTALRFTLYGTPGGAATLQIAGVDRSLVLQETQAGIYEGVYTVAAGDRIAADSRVSADLALGQRVTSAVLEEPLVLLDRLVLGDPEVEAIAVTAARLAQAIRDRRDHEAGWPDDDERPVPAVL